MFPFLSGRRRGGQKKQPLLISDHPGRGIDVASRHFINAASTPPLEDGSAELASVSSRRSADQPHPFGIVDRPTDIRSGTLRQFRDALQLFRRRRFAIDLDDAPLEERRTQADHAQHKRTHDRESRSSVNDPA